MDRVARDDRNGVVVLARLFVVGEDVQDDAEFRHEESPETASSRESRFREECGEEGVIVAVVTVNQAEKGTEPRRETDDASDVFGDGGSGRVLGRDRVPVDPWLLAACRFCTGVARLSRPLHLLLAVQLPALVRLAVVRA
jgi:hypothetical protein